MRGEVIVRRAEEKDIERIAELWWEMAQFHKNYPVLAYKAKPREKYINAAKTIVARSLKKRKNFSFVAVKGAEVIGFVSGSFEFYLPSPFVYNKLAYVKHLSVTEKYRGIGVGKALMNAVFQEAKKKGIKIAYLNVHMENVDAIKFYEELGFKKVQYKLMKVLE